MRLIILILILTTTLHAHPQNYRTLPTQPQLPVANIHCIFRDTEGYLWYGTNGGGLCRDNGYQIDIFRRDATHPLPLSNNIRCIAEDAQGNIWFGTPENTYYIDKHTYTIHSPFGKGNTTAIHLHTDSTLWISHNGQIINIPLHTKEPQAIESPRGDIAQFHTDPQHNLYALHINHKLSIFNSQTKQFEQRPLDIHVTTTSIIDDENGTGFWIGTDGQGIVHYDKATGKVTPQPETTATLAHSNILHLLKDNHNAYIYSTTLYNLYTYTENNGQLQPIALPNIPTTHKVLDKMFLDTEGNVYVSGWIPNTFVLMAANNDIERLDASGIRDLSGLPLIADRMVQDGDSYWIMQGRIGLTFWHPASNTFKHIGKPFSFCLDKCKGQSGIWAASDSTLYLIANSSEINIQPQATLTSNITDIHDAGNGNIYIGTESGLNTFNATRKKVSQLCHINGAITDIDANNDGNIYFLANGHGVFRYNKNKKPENLTPSTKEDFTAITSGRNGTLWASTAQGSVFRLSPGEKQMKRDSHISNSNGDLIRDIAVDRLGHVWILSDQYAREFNAYTYAFRTIRNTDPEVNVAFFYQFEPIADGRMGIGAAGAFCIVEPSSMLDRETSLDAPPIVTAVTINDTTILRSRSTQNVEVPANCSSFILMCSTLQPLHADQITFAYRIEGWMDEWVYLPQGVNTIYLNNLPNGKHTLQLRSTDRGGCWNTHIGEFVINRLPHWWETWWAISIFVLLIAAFAYMLVMLNRKIRFLRWLQQKRREMKLATIELKPEELHQAAKTDDEFLKNAIKCVESNIGITTYNVQQFSSDMCMSRANLYRKLQTLTGLSPTEFIRDIRLKQAAQLLKNYPDIAIGELSKHVGFQTPSYFAQCFKEKFGVTPSQYVAESNDN